MPTFVCRIGNADGTILEEDVQADDETDARERLRRRGVVVFTVRPRTSLAQLAGDWTQFSRKITPAEFLIFNQELLVLIKSGLPILRVLDLLTARSQHPRFRVVLEDVRERIRGGSTLADAMAAHPKYFSELYVASVRAGERSGNVVEILLRFQSFMKQMQAVRKKVISALTYPLFLIAVGVGVMAFQLVFVMPTFLEVYSESKAELPWATQWLMKATNLARQWVWVLALGTIGIAGLIRFWKGTTRGRALYDAVLLRLPMIGPIVHSHYTINMSRTLATILAGGIPLLTALQMVRESLPNRAVAAIVDRVIERVRTGSGLAAAFSVDRFLPSMTLEMIEVGETTGSLEEMLNHVADFHEDELDRALTRITTWVEPVLLLMMGLLVATVVIAMYLPIFNLAGTIQ